MKFLYFCIWNIFVSNQNTVIKDETLALWWKVVTNFIGPIR